MAARNIDEIMDLFLHDPFWEIGLVKTPDQAKLHHFAQSYCLPEDYLKLLSISDGFVLFHGGDFRINDIGWTLECKNNPEYQAGFVDDVLEVGCFLEQNLLLNQRESHTSSYLYAGDCCSFTDYVRIGTITDFLNGFIEAKGEVPFWETRDRELFDFSADNLHMNPGILEAPARGRTVVSIRPYYPSEEEIRVNGLKHAVIIEYSNGMKETIFLHEDQLDRYKPFC